MEELKFMTKKELCHRWGISSESLRVWLQDPDCLEELKKTGYKNTQKRLNVKQLEIIRRHLE